MATTDIEVEVLSFQALTGGRRNVFVLSCYFSHFHFLFGAVLDKTSFSPKAPTISSRTQQKPGRENLLFQISAQLVFDISHLSWRLTNNKQFMTRLSLVWIAKVEQFVVQSSACMIMLDFWFKILKSLTLSRVLRTANQLIVIDYRQTDKRSFHHNHQNWPWYSIILKDCLSQGRDYQYWQLINFQNMESGCKSEVYDKEKQ